MLWLFWQRRMIGIVLSTNLPLYNRMFTEEWPNRFASSWRVAGQIYMIDPCRPHSHTTTQLHSQKNASKQTVSTRLYRERPIATISGSNEKPCVSISDGERGKRCPGWVKPHYACASDLVGHCAPLFPTEADANFL